MPRQLGASVSNTCKQQSLAAGGRKQRRRGTRRRASGRSAGRGARCNSPRSQVTTLAARSEHAPKNLPDRTGHTLLRDISPRPGGLLAIHPSPQAKTLRNPNSPRKAQMAPAAHRQPDRSQKAQKHPKIRTTQQPQKRVQQQDPKKRLGSKLSVKSFGQKPFGQNFW